MRQDYVIAMEIVPVTPLTHGAGNDGNESRWRTMEYLVDVPDPDMPGTTRSRKIRVPIVSGAAFKATLRQHALGFLVEALGLEDGSLSRDALRLLLKGGKNDSSGQSLSLDEHRRLRKLFPMLAVFGSMDGGLPITGQLKVSPVLPYIQELVDSGLISTRIGGLEVDADGQEMVSTPQIELYEGLPPQRLHQLQTVEQYYRHDMRVSPHLRLMQGEEALAIEDKTADVKAKKAPKKAERRDANESMPHAHQAIVPGARLIAEMRLGGATQVEWECLAYAIQRWIQHGARLGGATSKGHGRCRVRVAGALAYQPPPLQAEAAPSTAITIEGLGSAYRAHILEHAEEIRGALT